MDNQISETSTTFFSNESFLSKYKNRMVTLYTLYSCAILLIQWSVYREEFSVTAA